jgi:hypothetical protein
MRAALLATLAAVCYAVGFVGGRVCALGLWCWAALVEGFKAGL